MKTKFLIIAAVIALTFTSCKKNSEKVEEAAPAVKEKENFSVELDVISEKEDNFAVYYTEDNTISFDGDKAIWNGVKAEAGTQKIVFNLSEEIIPTDIRLDLGLKKGSEQGDVILEKFKISYFGKSFEAKGSDFFKYFIENKDTKTEIDAAKGTVKFLKNPSGTATPFFYPQQALLDEISKITK